MSLLDTLIVRSLPLVPKAVVRRVASRYVAGETQADAVRVIKQLNAEGCSATTDVLGEFTTDEREATATTNAYLEMLDAIGREKLDSGVSIKLTAFGLDFPGNGQEVAFRNARLVVERAKAVGRFVRIDMENTPYTDRTIAIYKRLRQEFTNVGIVLQAYLRRTPADIDALIPVGPDFRLCKGIYRESRDVAWKQPDVVNRNYRWCLEKMLTRGARVGIATHDERLVHEALYLIDRHKVPASQFEFQMLLGVDEPLRRIIRGLGHPVRVYVPYGRDWYGYSCRRLRENPRIGRYVFLAMLPGRSK